MELVGHALDRLLDLDRNALQVQLALGVDDPEPEELQLDQVEDGVQRLTNDLLLEGRNLDEADARARLVLLLELSVCIGLALIYFLCSTSSWAHSWSWLARVELQVLVLVGVLAVVVHVLPLAGLVDLRSRLFIFLVFTILFVSICCLEALFLEEHAEALVLDMAASHEQEVFD